MKKTYAYVPVFLFLTRRLSICVVNFQMMDSLFSFSVNGASYT